MTIRASIVSSSMPTSETRTYASTTSPLSRMMSITSAKPLGRGRSRYPPRGAVAIAIEVLLPRTAWLGLVGVLRGQAFVVLAHQTAPDVGTVLCERLRDLGLLDPVQVADRPVELLQGVL